MARALSTDVTMLLGAGLGMTTTVAPRDDWKLREATKRKRNDQNGEIRGGLEYVGDRGASGI